MTVKTGSYQIYTIDNGYIVQTSEWGTGYFEESVSTKKFLKTWAEVVQFVIENPYKLGNKVLEA